MGSPSADALNGIGEVAEVKITEEDLKKANDKLELFHKTLGIIQGTRGFWTGRLKKDPHSHENGDFPGITGAHGSYYEMLLRAHRNHSHQYWFIASLVNSLYLIQIILAATATAVSALKVNNSAVTI